MLKTCNILNLIYSENNYNENFSLIISANDIHKQHYSLVFDNVNNTLHISLWKNQDQDLLVRHLKFNILSGSIIKETTTIDYELTKKDITEGYKYRINTLIHAFENISIEVGRISDHLFILLMKNDNMSITTNIPIRNSADYITN